MDGPAQERHPRCCCIAHNCAELHSQAGRSFYAGWVGRKRTNGQGHLGASACHPPIRWRINSRRLRPASRRLHAAAQEAPPARGATPISSTAEPRPPTRRGAHARDGQRKANERAVQRVFDERGFALDALGDHSARASDGLREGAARSLRREGVAVDGCMVDEPSATRSAPLMRGGLPCTSA